MKKYENPMLSVVSISKKDIIATSLSVVNEAQNDVAGDAAGRRMDDWDAGY